MASLQDIRIHVAADACLPKVDQRSIGDVPVYIIRSHAEPVVHVEFIFSAGRNHTRHPMVPVTTASMLNEGTSRRTSQQIAEDIEYYGSTLRTSAGTDALAISLYSMSRFLDDTTRILEDLLTNSIFPERELIQYKHSRTQKLEIASKKNEYVANREFGKMVFGQHPYGYSATMEDIWDVDRVKVLDHFKYLTSPNLTVFMSGDVREDHMASLECLIRAIHGDFVAPDGGAPRLMPVESLELDGPQNHQCAIRIGRQIISRDHPDYPGIFLLNTLLGGYFGSRLMKNIREDKGLTYGISSSLETLAHGASLTISTESSGDNRDRVLEEIRRELHKLHTELVPDDEFGMVRNYIRGVMLMQLDGAFRAMDVVKTYVMETGSLILFDSFIDQLMEVTPADIRTLSKRYLAWDDLHKVVIV